MSIPPFAKHRLARSFADLSRGGDAFGLLVVGMLSSAVAGTAVGAILGRSVSGLAAGLLLGALGWMTGVAWGHAHLIRQSPLRHKRLD